MSKNQKNLLIAILLIAAILRIFNLASGDPVNDEVFYSFRAIGLMDFDEAERQTTPLEWFDPNIPSWTKLSFHDHPPLVFWVQHIFLRIFGENNFAFRLPSALLGIVSVYLIYLIGRRLFSEKTGLLSAALFGLTLNNIYISRVGLQEAYVIFFLLLASYFFLRSLKEDKYLIWTGVVLGFGFLTKYNIFILVPIFLTYLLFFKRDYFFNKKLWLGGLWSLIIFSPVIIYNFKLYQAVGHFDFQFSYIFGQQPEVWKVAPGKEVGTLLGRLREFIPRLIATHSWIFLSMFALTILTFLTALFKGWKEVLKKHAFLIIALIYLTALLIIFIGPSYRFLTMLTPFMAIAVSLFLIAIYEQFLKGKEKLALALLGLVLVFEVFYAVNNQVINYPIGPTPWLSSKVRFENYNWGYNNLGQWIENELKGKIPALTFDLQYQFLEELREKALARGVARDLERFPVLIVYAGNFDKAARLWVLDRLHIYHAWPIISLETYYDYLQENGFDYYERVGFKNYYFILKTNIVPSPAVQQLMRGELITIKNPRGDEVFQIYKF